MLPSPILNSDAPRETELVNRQLEFDNKKDLNTTLDLDEEGQPWLKDKSFSFNRALSETQYFSFDRESKAPDEKKKRTGFASSILETFRKREKPAAQRYSPVQDMIGHNTSDEFVDRSFSGQLTVIKNHLKMSILISTLLFGCLVLPYFFEWYSEPSTVPGAMLYFGLNKVWVPVQQLIFDEATNT